MTARILIRDGYHDGDQIAIEFRTAHFQPRGQLWEREAERVPVDHVTTGRFRRTHAMSSPVWAFLPLSPAGWCKFYRELDAQYGTRPGTPLHHDGRCPVHAPRSILYGLTSIDDE